MLDSQYAASVRGYFEVAQSISFDGITYDYYDNQYRPLCYSYSKIPIENVGVTNWEGLVDMVQCVDEFTIIISSDVCGKFFTTDPDITIPESDVDRHLKTIFTNVSSEIHVNYPATVTFLQKRQLIQIRRSGSWLADDDRCFSFDGKEWWEVDILGTPNGKKQEIEILKLYNEVRT